MRKLTFIFCLLALPMLGLSQSEPINAMISPNPVRNYCEITTSQPVVVRVLDMQGKLITQTTQSTFHDVDLSDVPEGIYFVHLIGREQVQTLRLVRSDRS